MSFRVTATVYQVRAILCDILAEKAANPSYQDRSHFDDYTGTLHRKGGIWNDRSGRVLGGITKADVTTARRKLLAIGYDCGFDEVDAMLCQGAYGEEIQVAGIQDAPVYFTPLRRLIMTAAERKRRHRKRARAEGKCSTCLVEPAREGLATCRDCNERSKARVYASRGRTYAA